ncbi:MAG: hypothetical protein JEY97_13860 [Bacteroidales bacterium]|nr:hypothetical protein [Bacteroidales bacterium]
MGGWAIAQSPILGTTITLERKFNAKAKQSVGGIYQCVLIIALSCNELTYTKIDEILTQTTMLQIKDWFHSMTEDSNLAKRKIAFANTT